MRPRDYFNVFVKQDGLCLTIPKPTCMGDCLKGQLHLFEEPNHDETSQKKAGQQAQELQKIQEPNPPD